MHRGSAAAWARNCAGESVSTPLAAESTPPPRTGPGVLVPILSYHQTGTQPPPGSPCRELVMPPRKLGLQLATLRAAGWRGLSLRELAPYLRKEKKGKVFGITFDDGYENNLTCALPILTSLGFTATVFVVSRQVGGTNEWDRAHGVRPTRIMDLDQLRAWEAAGMEIGAHTRTHPVLTDCDCATAQAEICGSKADLEAALGHPIVSFSYPHGLFSRAHVEAVRAAGFEFAVTTRMAKARDDDDFLKLPRLSVLADDSTFRFHLRVATRLPERLARARNRLAGGRSAQAFMMGDRIS
jgi:peptidoglycan/xylan/chitin deacetylase (PgdA/CDA1 family)